MARRRNLPVLTSVELHNFSLYRNNRHLKIPVRRGVFCLAGANGMGKSSFLAAVNFAARRARELGLRMDITMGSGWPYGGSHITPELAAWGPLLVFGSLATARWGNIRT